MRVNVKRASVLAVIVAVLGIAFTASTARAAADMPLKLYGKVVPTDVYRVGIAIKQFARDIVKKTAGKAARNTLLSLTANKVSGKKPSDAVQAVYALHDQVNVLRKQKGLKRIGRYARKDGKVTPAIVFINAGIALDGLAQISQRIDSTKNYGDLYEAPELSGKTPSDVYAIMNLSSRILAALTAKPGRVVSN